MGIFLKVSYYYLLLFIIDFIMRRIFFFLIGFGLSVVGFSYVILYFNLFSIGYNLEEYVNFIIRRLECYYSVLGIFIMIIASMIRESRDNE